MFLVRLHVVERIGRRRLGVLDRQLAERRGRPIGPAPVRQRLAPVVNLDNIELAGILPLPCVSPTTPIMPILSVVLLGRSALPDRQ
jgi:hypothetical protein